MCLEHQSNLGSGVVVPLFGGQLGPVVLSGKLNNLEVSIVQNEGCLSARARQQKLNHKTKTA
jgi:hypothetical protein